MAESPWRAHTDRGEAYFLVSYRYSDAVADVWSVPGGRWIWMVTVRGAEVERGATRWQGEARRQAEWRLGRLATRCLAVRA